MKRLWSSALVAWLFAATPSAVGTSAYEYANLSASEYNAEAGQTTGRRQRRPARPRRPAAPRARPQPRQTEPIKLSLHDNERYYIQWLRDTGRLTFNDKVSFVIYDVENQKKIVSIFEDTPRISASTFKVYVLAAFYHQVNEGKIWRTPLNSWRLYRMIKNSDNAATNAVMRRIAKSMGMKANEGPAAVQKILSEHYPYFPDTKIVEFIPEEGEDAGRILKTQTTVQDLNMFYVNLWLRRFPYSDNMLWYLGREKRDRLYDETCIPEGVLVYQKTGTLHGQVSDGGIYVFKGPDGKEHVYISTGIIQDRTKTQLPAEVRAREYRSWSEARGNYLRRMNEGAFDFMYETHTDKPYICKRHGGNHLLRRQ